MSNERNHKNFQTWLQQRYPHATLNTSRNDTGGYAHPITNDHWEGWMARQTEIDNLLNAINKTRKHLN